MNKAALHVAFLTPEYVSEPKFDGGLANYLYRVAKGMQQLGHAVEIFVLAEFDEQIVHEGVRVHRVQRRVHLGWRLFRRSLARIRGPRLELSCSVRDGARSLARALAVRHADLPFDIVQCSDFGATALFLPRRRSYRLVSRISWHMGLWRQAQETPPTLDRRWCERLERLSMARSDLIYGPSKRLAGEIAARIGRPVRILRPPVSLSLTEGELSDATLRERLAGLQYVLFFGRICRLKGVLELASAMSDVLSQHEQIHLVMAGREDSPGMLEEVRLRLGEHQSRLIHISRLRHPELFPVIRAARCVVLPSRIDNFPNAGIETILNGQILVGTREASFDEMITDGESGFLASHSEPGSLRTAILRALALTSEQRTKVLASALKSIQRFSSQGAIGQLLELYETQRADSSANPAHGEFSP